MRRLARAIQGLEEPAVEKIAEEQQDDPFQILIATMLSAQTRDEVTAAASRAPFSRCADAKDASPGLPAPEIERLIYPVSFYRNKAVHVREACQQILERFGGVVPRTMEELLTLPGVGRKTANLVLILAHRSSRNICVDTHVHRISNRLGWVVTRTPEETEHALYAVMARRWWPVVNLYLVTWGQNVCRPVYPLCHGCAVAALCPKIGVTKMAEKRSMKRDESHCRLVCVCDGVPPAGATGGAGAAAIGRRRTDHRARDGQGHDRDRDLSGRGAKDCRVRAGAHQERFLQRPAFSPRGSRGS